MKILIRIIFLLVASGFDCYPQSFRLAGDSGPLANGAQVFQLGPSDTLQLITWLHLTNHSVNTLDVMMKKEEISMLPGGSSSICWAGYCYSPEMMLSTFSLSIPSGDTVSGCFAHFGPNGCRGVSVIRWTFFDAANPNDSLSITAHYSTFPSAVENIPSHQFLLTAAGPVPADDQIMLRHSLPPGIIGRVELRNEVGRLVSACEPVYLSGTDNFNTSGISPGMYFCTLVIDGKPVATRKITVFH